MTVGREVIGKWRDGSLMFENPTEDEILAHYDELKALMNQEQRQMMEVLRNSRIQAFYYQMTKGKTVEEAIRVAIQTWWQQYPWEVQPFINDINLMRDTLINKGYSNDKDKSMLFIGRMPSTIKNLLLRYNPNFFEKDIKGRCKNVDLFYSMFRAGKIKQ